VADPIDSGPITFLMHDAFGGGGVARTTVNLANHLARTRDVRVISLYRRRAQTRFKLDDAVDVTLLDDLRDGRSMVRRPLARVHSRLRPRPSEVSMSLLTDLLLRKALGQITSGVVVSTRPSLHLALTAYAHPGVTTVGWDHLNFPARYKNPRQREVLRTAIRRLDGYVVLTDADAADYRRDLPDARTEIQVIRNSVTWPIREHPPALDSKVVVAAGRLVQRKGFKRLIRAFAPVARSHPDWQLHIYGRGEQHDELEAQIGRLGLDGQVRLQGYNQDFPSVLANASVYAMGSTSEGFPMVLIEAMSNGIPLIAFDCPRGPGEIIRDGKNGLLIPEGPVGAFTEGLRALVEDAELRVRMGAQGLQDAEAYTIDKIASDWETFLGGLVARPRVAL
jgi:glycosyltransferase involved in cell wall biosynthesis